jgi:inosose dehydratase
MTVSEPEPTGSNAWAPRVGINPIVWTNDDFHDLGDATSLDRCLAETRAAGFAGTELGRKFPRQPEALRAALAAHSLALVSGWHSLYLLEQDLDTAWRELQTHLELLSALGTDVAIVAECSRRHYNDAGAPLCVTRNGDGLAATEWDRLAAGLDTLAARAAERGMRLAYHHHMGTVVQTAAEIDRLMASTRNVGLLIDTGHLAFAGADPLAVLARHQRRVAHVHLKNVRPTIVERASQGGWSFSEAVRAGVFTVPGDGGIDFAPIIACLRQARYQGWLVVEAEQDPSLAPPFEYATRAREHLRTVAGV